MKKLIKMLVLIMVSVLAVSAVLISIGCGGAPTKNVPSNSFAVLGNGGLAVQQGEYVYYVNGYADPSDDSGNTNKTGSVTRGGIVRTRLADIGNDKAKVVTYSADVTKKSDEKNNFEQDPYMGYFGQYKSVKPSDSIGVQKFDENDASGLEMTDYSDYTDKKMKAVKVEHIVKKKVCVDGKDSGGLFIFDNWLYFATPNNEKNSSGKVMFSLIDFMRVRLDGSKLERIATSKSSEIKPTFGVFKVAGKTYLVTYDANKNGGKERDTLYSYVVSEKKIGRPVVLKDKVKSAIFPIKPVYFNGMAEDGVEDFVYYTQDPANDDSVTTGNIVGRIRPNGGWHSSISANGNTVELLDAKYGFLFYSETSTRNSNKTLFANDLGGKPLDASKSLSESDIKKQQSSSIIEIFAQYDKLSNAYVSAQIVNVERINSDNSTNFSSRRVTATPYVIATQDDNTCKIVGGNVTKLFDGTAIVQSEVNGTEFIYTKGEKSKIYKGNINEKAGHAGHDHDHDHNHDEDGVISKSETMETKFFKIDVVGDFVFFIAGETDVRKFSSKEKPKEGWSEDDLKDENKIYKKANNFTHVVKITDNVKGAPQWIAAIIEKNDLVEEKKEDDKQDENHDDHKDHDHEPHNH